MRWGGMIGTSVVAAAAPDGYTLLLVSSTFTINPAIRKNIPFDTIKGGKRSFADPHSRTGPSLQLRGPTYRSAS